MSIPKNHHIIPQLYLRRFCEGNKLWLYDRYNMRYWQQYPKEIMKKTHYYSITEQEGTKNPEIEKLLSLIEGYTIPVLSKIDKLEPLNNEDKSTLSRFLAWLFVRVQIFEKVVRLISEILIRDEINAMNSNEDQAERTIRKYERQTSNTDKHVVNTLVDFVKRNEYTITLKRDLSLEMMIRIAPIIGRLLHMMDWTIHTILQDGAFITSDNPFIIMEPPHHVANGHTGVGILSEGAIKVVPLSSKTCLVMGDIGPRIRYLPIDPNVVCGINEQILLRSDRYIMAKDKDILDQTVRMTNIDN